MDGKRLQRQTSQMARLLEAVRETDEALTRGYPVDRTLNRFFKGRRELGSRDRRLINELVFAYYRWKGWLVPGQAELDVAANLIYAHALDAPTPNPAVVQWAETILPTACFPMGWAALPLEERARQLASARPTTLPLAVEQLIPQWAVETLAAPDGGSRAAFVRACITSFQSRPPTWIRCVKGRQPNVLAHFARHPYDATPDTRLANACAVNGAMSRAFLHDPAANDFEVQDLASQGVGHVADPQAGEHWWDVCAGAGGKTLHLADLMQGRGVIDATDTRPHALDELARRATRTAQASIIRTHATRDALSPSYDGVLVDAPCSGMGTWSRSPDARWRMDEKHVQELARIQHQLLDDVAAFVRPGGSLVYAVCTMTHAETIAQYDRFAAHHPEFVPLPLVHPLTGATSTSGHIWIYPWEGPCGAMFIAKWRRKE